VAHAFEVKTGFRTKEGSAASTMDRRFIDLLMSWSGALVAIVMVALGAAAIFGGSFALDNVRDRLEPQNITFPPLEAMSPAEQADIGAFAGQSVDTGTEAEAFSRYIGGHLTDVNEGATYSETSAAARAEGIPKAEAAELQAKADTLFKGETLKAVLLNAYGWWTVGQITFFAGIGMVVAGLVLAVLALLGFRHSRRAGATA
jgi:hypothetical protein